jgi:hypothetical protein
MFSSVVVTKKDEWDGYIDKSFDFDFYHTWRYHDLDKRGTPMLFVYKEQDAFIALPLIKRKIDGSDLYDMTSVYGYTGPVSNKSFEYFNYQTFNNFGSCFCDFVKKENGVSVFSRLNPFFKQNTILADIGGIRSNGRTVYMDLSVPLEEQWKNYHKRLLRQVKQLRTKNFLIRDAECQDDIKIFTEMYTENMDRLSASQAYYFSEEHFTNLLQTSEFNCKLILIFDGPVAICGAIVAWSKYIIRNHLSATNNRYVNHSPSKLLTDEISMIGRRKGMKYFHLGGGVGGREDSLLAFKSYFSPLFLEDYIWCYIFDQPAYDSLVNRKNIKVEEGLFPLYRN